MREEMLKILNPEFIPKSREPAVKRVKPEMTIGVVAKELGLVEPSPAQLGEGSREREAQSAGGEGGYNGAG